MNRFTPLSRNAHQWPGVQIQGTKRRTARGPRSSWEPTGRSTAQRITRSLQDPPGLSARFFYQGSRRAASTALPERIVVQDLVGRDWEAKSCRRFCQSRPIPAIGSSDNCTAKLVMTGVTRWQSCCLTRLFAKANPAPRRAVVQHPTRSESCAENPARRTCPDAGGAPPARYPTRRAPALSCDWRGGWKSLSSNSMCSELACALPSLQPNLTHLETLKAPVALHGSQ
jgi:hypothetical protein